MPITPYAACGIAVAAVALLVGCGSQPAPPQPSPASQPAAAPASRAAAPAEPGDGLPDLPEQFAGAGSTEVLVRTPFDPTRGQDGYVRNDKLPTGSLIGACRFTGPQVRNVYGVADPEPLDIRKGAMAIPEPQEGELEYYDNLDLRDTLAYYLRASRANELVPAQVVVRILDVTSGPTAMPTRPAFTVKMGYFYPHIRFGPVGDRVYFSTVDKYATHYALSFAADGKLFAEGKTGTYDPKYIDLSIPWGSATKQRYAVTPEISQTDFVEKPGLYAITSKRHKWQTAWLFVVENPYATVVEDDVFRILEVPVGKYTVEVWHPVFEPVHKTFDVEIRKDENAELLVEFKPPAKYVHPLRWGRY